MSRALVEARAAVGDPDPHDWKLALKCIAAFAVFLFIVDVLL